MSTLGPSMGLCYNRGMTEETKEITVCKAGEVGDQVVEPVVLKITANGDIAADAVLTETGWQQELDAHYAAQAELVCEALRQLPMATRHRVLAKLLLEHPVLLRIPGDDAKLT